MNFKKRILITGGAGNIAGALATKLSEIDDYQIVIVDNLSTGDISKLPDLRRPNIKFIKLDVNDLNAISTVMCSEQFDLVFHYAAVVGVQRTLAHPMLVLADIEGIKNILELSKNTGVGRVVFSSSSEVYGEPFEIPQNENTTPLNSRLPYAVVKNVGETFFRSYFREYSLAFNIFRFFNTYGPNQSEDFVLPRFIDAALMNKPLTVHGAGDQTRTFCYIDDNTETTVRIAESLEYENSTINIGSDHEISIINLAKLVIELARSTSEIIHLPALTEGDMTRRCPDNSLMKDVLGRDLVSLEEGILKLVVHKKALL